MQVHLNHTRNDSLRSIRHKCSEGAASVDPTLASMRHRSWRRRCGWWCALAHTSEHNEFGPGAYKLLVTLVTEQSVDQRTFPQNATDETVALADRRLLAGDITAKSSEMPRQALNTMEDQLGVSADAWMSVQGRKIERYAVWRTCSASACVRSRS